MTNQELPTFDCVIFSGGGAKGAYGAGAAKALCQYRELRHVTTEICWLGASAGALNATVMAMYGADRLLEFWRNISNRQILDVWITSQKFQATKRWLLRKIPFMNQPFSIYPNSGLRKLIENNTEFEKLENSHLIVAVTDYTVGKLKAFAYTPYFEEFKQFDKTKDDHTKRPIGERRLEHWDPLTSELLVDALLASCAIPICFPPVKIRTTKENGEIEQNWYIDGGVGNNTPTREAAYFLRFVNRIKKGIPGEVFCVKLIPPRQRQDGPLKEGVFDITRRTVDVFHHIHTQPIINAWYRISDEVKGRKTKVQEIESWLGSRAWNPEVVDAVSAQVKRHFGDDQTALQQPGQPATARIDPPLHIIEPTQELGDTLDFERDIEKMIVAGHSAMLQQLWTLGKMTKPEYDHLVGTTI